MSALAESGFELLARTGQFMLTEEAHHMFVGDTGLNRVVKRTAQLMKEGDVRELGGIPLDIIQKHINFWFSYSLDFSAVKSVPILRLFRGRPQRTLQRTGQIQASYSRGPMNIHDESCRRRKLNVARCRCGTR